MSDPQDTAATIAWIDARNGVAGDMLLGALVDAGASLEVLQRTVDAVLPDTVRLSVSEVRRAGMRASKVEVATLAEDHPHRHWTEIRDLLRSAALDPAVQRSALRVFEALARAESRAHGIDVEEVHFHEVGAWDSIADVVGVCAGLHNLGVSRLFAGPVGVGSGSVRTAHGDIPVPVPAVLELSRGWEVLAGGRGELATPTGMALVVALAEPSVDLPEVTVRAVGVGAGTRDDPSRPNIVRIVLGDQPTLRAAREVHEAVVLEANVDDVDPRVWPEVLTTLLAAGADDAWLTPILMKKGRPAHTLSVLAAPERAGDLRERVFELVPTLGVREHPVSKDVLARGWQAVAVGSHEVRIKVGLRSGRIITATPEFADVAAVAEATGRPVREVLAAAGAAAVAAGLTLGAPAPG